MKWCSFGQREGEGAPLAEAARHGDVPAVLLDDVLHDREPEPDPLARAAAHLVELLEDVLEILLRDADALVRHRDLDRDGVLDRLDEDARAARRELDRVADEVDENLLHEILVPVDERESPAEA